MSKMRNLPVVKLALVGVSRDCFPAELTRRRLACVKEAGDADVFRAVSWEQ